MALELKPDVKARLISYCKIDELSEDDLKDLTRFYFGAVSYMTNAGISEPKEGTPRRAQYDGLVDALVLDKWDHRGRQVVGQELFQSTHPVWGGTANIYKMTCFLLGINNKRNYESQFR